MGKIIETILVVIVIIFILYLLAIMPRMIHRPDFKPFTGVLYAHRGLHDNATDAPENTMAAFAKAVEAGYGIELDIQLTKDEVVVVCHDADLERVAGSKVKIAELTFEELQQYTICNTEQRVPKFTDVLALVDGKVPLIIEYKEHGASTRLCEIADEILQNYDGLYCIESFNPLPVFWYRLHRKEVVRGILSDSYIKEGYSDFPKLVYQMLHHLLLNFVMKPDFIAYNVEYYDDVSRNICYKLYKAPAVAWTVKSQQQLEDRQEDYDIFIFDSFVPR